MPSACRGRERFLAFILPIAAMAISDTLLGFSDWPVTMAVYAASALPAALGLLARRSAGPILILSLAATSSVIFFVVTNFAVWISGGMYTLEAAGLLRCYVAALPFFQTSLVGDLFWTAVLFGARRVWLSSVLRDSGAATAR
jgi:hypothetical protein